MNIDELNPQNSSTNNSSASVEVPDVQEQNRINQVQMAANGMSPFATPQEPQQPKEEPQPIELNAADLAVPTYAIENVVDQGPALEFKPTLVIEDPDAPKPAPVPIPEPTQSVVDNSQVPPVAINNGAPANPAPTTVDNAPLPPLPDPNVAPVNTQEVTVVNTAKRHSGSNFILIVLALLLVLFVYKIDFVIEFVKENILTTNPTDPGEISNNNLVDGFIKIEDSTSNYTLKEIKFYNFKKQPDNKLLFNYTSPKNYNNARELGIYIEIYNSNKELLSKYLFDEASIGNSEVGSSILDLGEQVYQYAYFAKPVIYSSVESEKESSLTCTYNDSNENYLLEYKVVYAFKNYSLTGYEVNKKIEVINNNKTTTNAINIISKENTEVSNFEIPTTFENNVLNYKVNLNNVNEGYIPYYSKGTTPTIIKMNETGKKWICE